MVRGVGRGRKGLQVPAPAVISTPMPKSLSLVIWVAVSLLGAAAFGVLALSRGETISAAWMVTAAVCTYAVAYRFYSRFIATRVMGLDDRRATPAERINNGRDFVPTGKWVLYGH